jgi:hypothetical protein
LPWLFCCFALGSLVPAAAPPSAALAAVRVCSERRDNPTLRRAPPTAFTLCGVRVSVGRRGVATVQHCSS